MQASFGNGAGDRQLTMASACSGSENGLCALLGLQVAMSQSNMEVHMVHSFSCEADRVKQKWIKTTIDELQRKGPYKAEASFVQRSNHNDTNDNIIIRCSRGYEITIRKS